MNLWFGINLASKESSEEDFTSNFWSEAVSFNGKSFRQITLRLAAKLKLINDQRIKCLAINGAKFVAKWCFLLLNNAK